MLPRKKQHNVMQGGLRDAGRLFVHLNNILKSAQRQKGMTIYE